MKVFEFTLRINQRLSEELEMDRVYERCQDTSLLVEGDVTLLQFHRQAASLQDAIRSAIGDVYSAGYRVAHVEFQPDAVAVQTVRDCRKKPCRQSERLTGWLQRTLCRQRPEDRLIPKSRSTMFTYFDRMDAAGSFTPITVYIRPWHPSMTNSRN